MLCSKSKKKERDLQMLEEKKKAILKATWCDKIEKLQEVDDM